MIFFLFVVIFFFFWLKQRGYNYILINSIGCLLAKQQTSNNNFFVVRKYEASTKNFQWVWEFEKTIKYHVSFIDSSELPTLCYDSHGVVGWKDWRLVKSCDDGGSVDMYYVQNKLVYDVVGDLLRRNNKLSQKIVFNSSQVYHIIGKRLRFFLLTHRSIRDQSLSIKGLNTMSIIALKKRLEKLFNIKPTVTSSVSQVLKYPDLTTEQTRQVLSLQADYGWVRKGRYVYLGRICRMSFSFKTFILRMEINVKRRIFDGRLHPFATLF